MTKKIPEQSLTFASCVSTSARKTLVQIEGGFFHLHLLPLWQRVEVGPAAVVRVQGTGLVL